MAEFLPVLLGLATSIEAQTIAALVLLNAVLGVALSIRERTFHLPRIFEWLWTDIVPLVLVWISAVLIGNYIESPIAANAVFALIVANLITRIGDKALKLGIAEAIIKRG